MADLTPVARVTVGTSWTSLIDTTWRVSGVILYIPDGGSTVQLGPSSMAWGDGLDLVAGAYLPLPAINDLGAIIDAGTQEVQVLGTR